LSDLPGVDEAALQRVTIRAAEPRDLPAVVALVRALAEYEKLPGPDAAAARRLADDFAAARYSLFVAEAGAQVIGYALYFFTYSTFLAQPSLYLEDLFVHPGARGRGIGERFMRALAGEAVRRGCGRFDWTVLDWNVDAQKFYRSLGAEVMPGWWTCRLTGEALTRLASSTK
jgi:GNAT superfamily N-acetyltransferase